MILRDAEGKLVPVIRVRGLRLVRGGYSVLEKLPWYLGEDKEWYVEQGKISEYLKEVRHEQRAGEEV